jgi:spermidine synthase
MAARTPMTSQAQTHSSDRPSAAREGDFWVYLVIALSGATALGAEVVWTRLFGMLLGATVYAFSIILAVFLVGLALGSAAGASLSRRYRPRWALGWSQLLLALAIAWTGWMIASSLPYWPVNPMLTISPWYTFQLDLVRCLWAILPAALCWGASFPLALAAVSREGDDPSDRVGAVYAANTLGAIVGALAVSITLVPAIGTQNCERLLLILAGAAALIAWAPELARARLQRRAGLTAFALAAAGVLCVALAISIHRIPGELVAYGRKMAPSLGSSKVLDVVEGRNSSVAITQWSDGNYEVDVNGHVEATTESFDMRLQRMVGFLPSLLESNPKSVLGIGFGAGVSAGTFTRLPTVQKITICEIEPVIPPTSTKYFGNVDYDVKDNPKTHIVYDDARHYLLTTRDTFDVIASDPLDIFVKGTAAIYSKEYFEAVKRHLNPGGYFSLYVPLYESDVPTVQSELATFFSVFPNGTVWGNTVNGQGYDLVLMGQAGPLTIDLDAVQARLNQPDYALVRQSLSDIGFSSAMGLYSTYAGQASDLRPWTQGAPLNVDADLKLQYMGGWGINSSLEDVIWQQMLAYRKPPVTIFRGTPEELDTLFRVLRPGSAQ